MVNPLEVVLGNKMATLITQSPHQHVETHAGINSHERKMQNQNSFPDKHNGMHFFCVTRNS